MKTRSHVVCHYAIWTFVIARLFCTPLSAQQMIFPGETWQVATPESVLVDSEKLLRAVELIGNTADSRTNLIVALDGRVIWDGSESQTTSSIWSATQSFGSTVLGLAIDRDLLTLDTLAAEFVPDMAADYPDVAMRHLVTHTSGYLAEGEIYPFVQLPPSSFIPASPLFNPPGSEFAYSHPNRVGGLSRPTWSARSAAIAVEIELLMSAAFRSGIC